MIAYRSASKIWREAARPKGTSNISETKDSKKPVTILKPSAPSASKIDNSSLDFFIFN